jgi:cellulose synthase/poly-beta-1,6-N-acetylglucosamine synthase-like glycosyltransferase
MALTIADDRVSTDELDRPLTRRERRDLLEQGERAIHSVDDLDPATTSTPHGNGTTSATSLEESDTLTRRQRRSFIARRSATRTAAGNWHPASGPNPLRVVKNRPAGHAAWELPLTRRAQRVFLPNGHGANGSTTHLSDAETITRRQRRVVREQFTPSHATGTNVATLPRNDLHAVAPVPWRKSDAALGPARPPTQPTVDLPHPPTEDEKYHYLRARRQWVMALQLISYGFVAYSTILFIQHFPGAELILIPLALSCASAICAFATTFQGRHDTRAGHDLRCALYAPETYPSVDVFLPSCGESLAVIDNTYRYVSGIEWPGELRVYVLDDAGSESVRRLCDSYGFHYLSRPDRGAMKKAGNLNFAFDRTEGDFIALFDADFAPRSDFLLETLPYFTEDSIGIVQSPQFFDVTSRQNWLQRGAGTAQEFFYRWVQPSRDRVSGAICVGTNAVYRRQALLRSGGFAKISHSEDVYTGINMIKVGYATRYIPVHLAKGLCPTEMTSFISQQYRWSSGSMSLLFSKEFHRTAMPLRQRMCFWSGFLYYLSTSLEVFIAPLPPILMVWLAPQWVRPRNYVFILISMLIWYLIYPVVTTGRGKRMDAARVHIVSSFSHFVAVWHIARKRPVEWVPTGVIKGATVPQRVRLLASVYLSVAQVILWVGIIRYAPQYGWARWWPMAVFGVITLIVTVPIVLSMLPTSKMALRSVHEHELADDAPGLAAASQ